MMQIPLVSIITVVRNDVQHIEQTMLSVLNQTYSNIEYIIIDGGSTDGTVDIIKKYAHRLTYWVSEPDGGIYPAMNKGLEHVKGDWVNFMNSGDTFVDEKVLEDVFKDTLLLKGKKVIGGHTYRLYPDHTEEWKSMPVEVVPAFIPYSHQSTFVRITSDIVWRFDLRYRIAADYKILYDLYYQYGKESFYNVDRFIANYRMEDSMTFGNLRRAKKEYLQIQAKHIDIHWMKEMIKYLLKK